MTDDQLQQFWKNRQHIFQCQSCFKFGRLFSEFKCNDLIMYNCTHVECIHCMLLQGENIHCKTCNTKYSYKKLVRHAKKNLPFLIQKLYNEIDICDSWNEHS